MSDTSLQELEREVEVARTRLARDLDILRSPATIAAFTDALKHEAVAAKDDMMGKARVAAQTQVQDWVDTLKAKAAANPAAVLAIGAGLAWRLIRRPPIASALVTAGLVSLLRANGSAQRGLTDADYVEQAQARLRQQAAQVSAGIAERAGSVASAARDRASEWSAEAAENLRQRGRRLADATATSAGSAADDLAARWSDAGETAGRAIERARRSAADVQRKVTNQDVADKLLLGAAAIAVTAALGIAAQRRISQTEPVD
jgi:hypothetical protein